MTIRVALLLLLLLTPVSCARTVYTNLRPQQADAVTPHPPNRGTPHYWRHFFIYGWVPSEVVVDAESYCAGTERIDRIETRLSFVQGLIGMFAGYYINIYAPYTGRVVCTNHVQ